MGFLKVKSGDKDLGIIDFQMTLKALGLDKVSLWGKMEGGGKGGKGGAEGSDKVS